MPVFDFDAPVNRRHTNSYKWRQPDDVLPMWVADTDFLAPPAVIEALRRRVEQGIFGYHYESPTLRQTVIDWVAERYHWQIEPDWIIFPPDVVRGMNWAAQAVAEPGDAVLLQSPVYGPFFEIPKNGGFLLQDAPLTPNAVGHYELDMAAMAAAVTPETKAFLLCNPQNPTGRVFTRPELETLAEFCLARGITVLADEIHADLIYSESQHIPIAALNPDIARNTITFIAPSKTFNVAGLKASVGIIPNPELRKKMDRASRGVIPPVNLLGMVAMEAAYSEGGPWLDALRAYLQANRDYLLAFIADGGFPGVRMARPEGTFLAWLDFRDTPWADAPAKHIRDKAKVVLNEGSWFGENGSGFVRLNFGCPRATLDEGLSRIREALLRADA